MPPFLRMSNFAPIDPPRLQDMKQHGDVVLVDVRTDQEVYNLAGGMNAWVGKGMPVATRG